MKFAIVVLSFNQIEQTLANIQAILAVKPRDFPDKNIYIVHNGSSPEVVKDLTRRFPRFYHVVQKQNEGFCIAANAGLQTAFQDHQWVLFLTQDTTLVHFPKAPPFEPGISAVRIYKRQRDTINSLGGAVDLDLAKHYYCTKPEIFWDLFESDTLRPFVPRTAFWLHQEAFRKTKGFDERLGSMWEDVDFSIRLKDAGVLIQLDETTEIIHLRKGICRKEPYYSRFLYNRNRFAVARKKSRTVWKKVLFEVGVFSDWLGILIPLVTTKQQDARAVWSAYWQSFLVFPKESPQPSEPPPKLNTERR